MVTLNAPAQATLDGNEAVARVAFPLSEIIAIYPITPSSPMAEHCDDWAAQGRPNLWEAVPEVVQLQSEGGVAGAVHGALTAGALTTTFTASQGLLLMIPNMYKIAGELTPFVMHVTARSLATHALSIFGDHADVMACRQTGFAILASNSVQEAQDIALISHAATLASRVPFLHFFDGFRTSHEVAKIELLDDAVLREMIEGEPLEAFAARGLTPDDPAIRGTAQNPDVYFQGREASNPYYLETARHVREAMEKFARLTGRRYHCYEYEGDPEAEEVVIMMGSGGETAAETARALNAAGRKTGVLKVRLYRPFDVEGFAAILPRTARAIAVLDRTKEPGALGEPLYLDVEAALAQSRRRGFLPRDFHPLVTGGRYGLGSKEFTPAMAKAVFDDLAGEAPKPAFTVGITDDVTGLSLPIDEAFGLDEAETIRAVFFGLGSDGTVGANKNSIKIIGEGTSNHAQGFFVYDSKKSGAMTVSHLRFGPKPIRAPYLIERAQFVACHQAQFLGQFPIAEYAEEGGTFLLNTNVAPDRIWSSLPGSVQAVILERGLRLFAIDAYAVAQASGMGRRINTIMQVCFFAISGVLPRDQAIAEIKKAIEKTYGRKGASIVAKNHAAVDATLESLFEVGVPAEADTQTAAAEAFASGAPAFVREVTMPLLAMKGDRLPVSAFPADGTWPTDTSRWEKRNIAQEIPVWDPAICIQCNKCVEFCPHATIRAKFVDEEALADAPEGFQSVKFRSKDHPQARYILQVAPEDCTGCGVCVTICPAKDKTDPKRKAINMEPQAPLRETGAQHWQYFLDLPDPDRTTLGTEAKSTQFLTPLFEFSGACSGCGETPYLKLLTQLFGDRLLIANATGCSSIYGGNLPTTPYARNKDGRGPAWSNSLFEDNAEFGFGMSLAAAHRTEIARALLQELAGAPVNEALARDLLHAKVETEAEVAAQRERIAVLKRQLEGRQGPPVRKLLALADFLVPKQVWIVGGDGWAYDIDFGGLDHILASGRNFNVLVLDTEVYSNTGGQQSKSTPMGAIAKFAAKGKARPKKDLALHAINSGGAYVARVALGAKDAQTVQAFREAASFDGPSLIIAYSHCIAHGYNMNYGPEQQKLAVQTGYWPLLRYDPRREELDQPLLKLDSNAPAKPLREYIGREARYQMLALADADRAKALEAQAEEIVRQRYAAYQRLATPLVESSDR